MFHGAHFEVFLLNRGEKKEIQKLDEAVYWFNQCPWISSLQNMNLLSTTPALEILDA